MTHDKKEFFRYPEIDALPDPARTECYAAIERFLSAIKPLQREYRARVGPCRPGDREYRILATREAANFYNAIAPLGEQMKREIVTEVNLTYPSE